MTVRESPALLQAFFTDYLMQQRQVSAHTVAAYRNSFRLLLRFAAVTLGRTASKLTLGQLDAALVGRFLEHLERERGNCARSRNARLAAVHCFFRYVALTEPTYALVCQRVLAIPSKRFERGIVEFLVEEEIDALLKGPDTATWIGRRDHALLLVAIQTGLRVSELIALRQADVTFAPGAHVRCHGKGPSRQSSASWRRNSRRNKAHTTHFSNTAEGSLSFAPHLQPTPLGATSSNR